MPNQSCMIKILFDYLAHHASGETFARGLGAGWSNGIF